MKSRAIPNYFFLNGDLHKFIKVVKSDNSVVAWNYPEESRQWYPRPEVRRFFKKAYTISDAARLMNIKNQVIYELIDKGLVKPPSRTYDLGSYRPLRQYINEDDMLEYRQAAWDQLPKNRFGEPYDDTMVNAEELLARMEQTDDRDYGDDGDGGLQRIYRA